MIATLAAFVTGYAAIAWLLRYLAPTRCGVFVAYRIPSASSSSILAHRHDQPATSQAQKKANGPGQVGRSRTREESREGEVSSGTPSGEVKIPINASAAFPQFALSPPVKIL